MPKKPKILVVCDKDTCTSFGRLSLDIFDGFQKMNADVSLLWLMTKDYFHRGAPKLGDTLEASSFMNGFFIFRGKVKSYLKQVQPDLIFWVSPELGFLVPGIKKRFPRIKNVVMVHDAFPKMLYPNSLRYNLIYKLFLEPGAAADLFVYNSRYSKSTIEKIYAVPNLDGQVLGCPVDFDLFKKPDHEISASDKLKFREARGMVGYVGMCLNVSLDEPRKNIETFFQMAKKRPDLAFVRIGKLTPRLQQLKESFGLKNVFHFSDLEADGMRMFYWHSDLFVYPSYFEGFGLPPVEALACGIPVVSARNSALEEVLDGVCPLMSPANDVDGYLSVLDDVLAGKSIVDSDKARKLFDYCSKGSFVDRLQKMLATLKL